MRCLVFFALITSGYAAAVRPFSWSDCGKRQSVAPGCSSSSNAMDFHFLQFYPNPIVFPGNLTISTSVTINRPIIALYLDVLLTKKTAFGPYVEVPCIGDTKLGTCQNIDLCNLLRDGMSISSEGIDIFDKQVQTILNSALGGLRQCPLLSTHIIMTSETITLKALPTQVAAIADGYFHVKLMLKESATSTEYFGCLEFHVGVEREYSGFLFR